jgi:predicted acetyltransferase
MVKNEGVVIAALVLIPQKWVLSGIELKVAEVGCVGTDPDYRGMGAQRILNDKFDEYAADQSYDLCVIAGIPYFYRQFGYNYAVDLDFKTAIETRKITVTGCKLHVRAFKETDIPRAQELLEIAKSKHLVHSKRTPEIWFMQHKTDTYGAEPFEAFSLIEGAELVAYIRLRQESDALIIREMGYVSEEYVEKALGYIREKAERKGLKEIISKLHYSHPLTRLLVKHGGKSNDPYAWQVKILDYEQIIRRIKSLLEKRIMMSSYRGFTDNINLNFWKFNIRMEIEDGEIKTVSRSKETRDRDIGINPYVFPKLMLGYRSIDELEYSCPDCIINPEYRQLVRTLFPKGTGFIHYAY